MSLERDSTLCSRNQFRGRFLGLPDRRWPILAVAALALLPVAVRAQSFSQPISVSKNPISAQPGAIAVDSNGNIVVAWRDSSGISFSRSSDGQTFSSPQTIPNSGGDSSQPQLAVDSSGHTNLLWAAGDLFLSRSSDGAGTFSNGVDVSQGLGTLNSKPQMALGPQGEIDVVWGRNDVFFSESQDGGTHFSVPLKLNVAPGDTGGPSIAIAPDDTTYVAWPDDLNHPQCNIFFTKSTNSGASFPISSNIPNSGCAFDPLQILADSAGNIDLLWRNDSPIEDVFFSRSTDGGSNFSAPLDLSNDAGFEPRMFLDMSSSLDVVWVGPVSGTSGAIFFRRSTDGAFFSPAKTVNVPAPVGTLGPSSPQIAVAFSGNIDIA